MAFSALLQGCESIEKLDFSRITEQFSMLFSDSIKAIEPPNDPVLSEYKNIVIKSNTNNENLTVSAIESELRSSKVGDDSYFSSVSFYDKSKKLDQSYAILSVNINPLKVNHLSIKESRIKCPGDGFIRSCDSSTGIKYTVDCTRTIATASGYYSISNTQEQKISSKNFKKAKEDTACEDHMSTPETAESLSYNASLNAGKELAQQFIPKVVERPNDLIKTDESLSSDDQKEMEKSFELASKGNVIVAKKTYEHLYKNSEQVSSLLYNIAYCELILGNYASAAELFEKYLSEDNAPKSDAQKYLDEANLWISKGINKVIERA